MKKLVSILVVAVLLFNTIGNLIVFESMRFTIHNDVKTSIKKSIPTNNLVSISINNTSKSLIRFVDDDEFIYNEKMYDIVRKEIKGDTTVYYCINDTKEEALFANLNHEVKKNMDTNPVKSKTQQILKKISISLFYQEVNNDYSDISYNIIYPINTLSISNQDYDVLTPPPKTV